MRSIAVMLAFLMCGRALCAQDSALVTRSDTPSTSALQRLTKGAVNLGRRSLTVVRRGAEVVFDVDSAVEQWSRRPDQTSATLRAVAPVTFWLPVAAVAATPSIWADEAKDGHAINAHYARAATVGLAAGFALSRATKTLIHRSRPCSGSSADPRAAPPDSADATKCHGVNDRASFPSEHAMALFAIATAASVEAQRQQAPNATRVTVVAFSTAGLLSLGRVYQHQHWLSDVLVGAAVGTATGFLGAQITPSRARKP